MSYSITDSIKEAIGQVASDHDLSAYAVMDLFQTVTDYVTDYLADEQFDGSVVEDIEEFLAAEEAAEEAAEAATDPAELVANAEEFIEGCERIDFFIEQGYSKHYLTGMRDRIANVLADNG